MAEKAILFDTTKCIACRACQVACKQWNELRAVTTSNRGTYENPPDLSKNTLVKVRFIETERNGQMAWLFSRQACMHCTDAACVKVCPPKALTHHQLGMVTYDESLCTGCGYCVDACPFHIPRTDRNLVTGIAKMNKCTMCTSQGLDRIDNGSQPACVKTCPPEALKFGDREALVAEGRAKVTTLAQKGLPNAYLYGDTELDGLHVLYVLDDSPKTYGLPVNPRVPAVTNVWQNILKPAGWMLGGLTIVGLALNFVIAREAKLKEERVSPDRKEK